MTALPDASVRIRTQKQIDREWEQDRRDWAKVKGHQQRIEQRLGVVYRRVGVHGQDFDVRDDRTPLEDILEREGGPGAETAGRGEALRALLEYFFADGPHPGAVLRRVYAVAWSLDRRGLLLNMTQTDMAMMFGETKAAMSWRIKKIFSGYLKKWGARGFKAQGQKSEEAVGAYARAQRGNHNRSQRDRNNQARHHGHDHDNDE